MRRIVILLAIVGGLLAWGSWTLDKLRQGDAQVREANQERLTLVGELQALERHLEDLDTMLETVLTNDNDTVQTSLTVALQDQRTLLWKGLEPIKPHLARDPVRLEGIEGQFESLGDLLGSLIKIRNKDGEEAAITARHTLWNQRFILVQKSLRIMNSGLQREVEEQWQATRVVQDELLRRMVFGVASIGAFAFLWVGFLLTRSKRRQQRTGELLDGLVGQLELDNEKGSAEKRLTHLQGQMRGAPIGQRFLKALITPQPQPTALIIDGRIHAQSAALAELWGADHSREPLAEVLKSKGVDPDDLDRQLRRAEGEWVTLSAQDDQPSTTTFRVFPLTGSGLRYVEFEPTQSQVHDQRSPDDLAADVAATQLMVATFNGQGHVLEANAQTCSYLAVEERDLQLAHLTDFRLGIDNEALSAIVEKLEATGVWQGEQVVQRQGKRGCLWGQVSKQAPGADGGDTYLFVGLNWDHVDSLRQELDALKNRTANLESEQVDNDQRLHMERQRLTSEATQAMQSFSHLHDLISAFGREMRDPLNGIAGLTELLRDAGAPHRVDQLRNVTSSLTDLVYDLLDYANLENDNSGLNLDVLDVEQITRDMVLRYVRHLRGSDVRIELAPMPDGPNLGQGDSQRVTQIVGSLLARATKHALPGGLIRIHLDQDDTSIRIRIFDAGGGVPAAACDEFFELSSYSGLAGSTRWSCVELAVLKSLALAMNAQLSAEALNDEIVWSIELPKAQTDEPSEPTQPPEHGVLEEGTETEDAPPVLNATVLVADDDEVNRLVATGLLERLGCESVLAQDGQEALDVLEPYLTGQGPAGINLILLDLMMPRVGGLATAEAIRDAERAHNIPPEQRLPIVAVTAKASQEDQDACLAVGMNAYVSKPYRHEDLEGLIVRFVLARSGV